MKPQPSFLIGLVLLGDASLLRSEHAKAPLSETGLAPFQSADESRLDRVFELFSEFASKLEPGQHVDLDQLESAVAAEASDGQLLSRGPEAWRTVTRERGEQILSVQQEENQTRFAALEEEDGHSPDLTQLEVQRKVLEAQWRRSQQFVVAFKKAAGVVIKSSESIVDTGFKLPNDFVYLDPPRAYVVRQNDRTAALAFLCEYATAGPDVPDEPISPSRTIRVQLVDDEEHVWHESTCDLLADKVRECQTDASLQDAVRARVRSHLNDDLTRRIKMADGINLSQAHIECKGVTLLSDPTKVLDVQVRVEPRGDDPDAGGDEPEARGASSKQVQVAGRIFDRMKHALSRTNHKLEDFYDLKFLILVPTFNTLQQQTADRVKEQGLLRIRGDGEKEAATDLVIQ